MYTEAQANVKTSFSAAHIDTIESHFALLTDRQKEVLRLVGYGLTNKQIAIELSLSPYTVGDHLKEIYQKLHVHNRTAATLLALRFLLSQ